MASAVNITGTEAWCGGEDEIRAAVEAVAVPDTEFSARLLYRSARGLMRRLGVRSPAQLHGILRQVFCNAEGGARFGDHLSVWFGDFDRPRQVRAFVARHPGEPRSVLAKGYEREYGFSAGVAAIWINRVLGVRAQKNVVSLARLEAPFSFARAAFSFFVIVAALLTVDEGLGEIRLELVDRVNEGALADVGIARADALLAPVPQRLDRDAEHRGCVAIANGQRSDGRRAACIYEIARTV